MKTSEKRYKKQYTHIKKRIRGGTRKQIWQGWTHTARRTWTCGRTHPFANEKGKGKLVCVCVRTGSRRVRL